MKQSVRQECSEVARREREDLPTYEPFAQHDVGRQVLHDDERHGRVGVVEGGYEPRGPACLFGERQVLVMRA